MKNDNVKFKNVYFSLRRRYFKLNFMKYCALGAGHPAGCPAPLPTLRRSLPAGTAASQLRGSLPACFVETLAKRSRLRVTPARSKINFILAIILVFFLSACGVKNTNIKKAEIKINNKTITAEVVETLEAQIKGLSGREKLGQNEGMLFVYTDKKIRTFWMKDMLFPIDIIWIADNKIADISENMSIPENGEIKRATPKEKINYVLEVNAGFVENNGLKIGDEVQIIL
ncbi:MAG: DUF192 domain-containing protein [bacterium]